MDKSHEDNTLDLWDSIFLSKAKSSMSWGHEDITLGCLYYYVLKTKYIKSGLRSLISCSANEMWVYAMVEIISDFQEETNVLYWFSEIYKAEHFSICSISTW